MHIVRSDKARVTRPAVTAWEVRRRTFGVSEGRAHGTTTIRRPPRATTTGRSPTTTARNLEDGPVGGQERGSGAETDVCHFETSKIDWGIIQAISEDNNSEFDTATTTARQLYDNISDCLMSAEYM